jgi:hypothetical protein
MYGGPTWARFERAITQASQKEEGSHPAQIEARRQLETIDWNRMSTAVTVPAQLYTLSVGSHGKFLADKLWDELERAKVIVHNRSKRPRQTYLGRLAAGWRDTPPNLTARFLTSLRFEEVQTVQQLLYTAQIPHEGPYLKLHQITWFEPEERAQAIAGTVKLQPDGAARTEQPYQKIAGYMWAHGFAWFEDGYGMTYNSTELVVFTTPPSTAQLPPTTITRH